ncbi:DUF3095 family protein [Rhizobium leguminosarum]|jgi:hypothetical protein|uniref:DUF3095 family protein n=1 Tax=Rhizobium leguminosarum TaxID=384 RepID=A0ABD7PY17_RHILE|nr:DUF3095 family protein [Rhizobium leguminosarum]MBY2907429.1 DUF3095 domain-containing protein [Rhizobium leguminosarum]MBY2916333.1 DUF3095 domain-containing protein [Rhizobium leguminosarum]MBY2923585.1 DUF3095 domain-containing protein [Rhizobium leguminosarum]MBY2935270.1 DUF3095 domain-containing protein [Rhizobium leguminosarum]MBY2947548.1 DUF3095 domain-containing protein [Rhizobium leguminosarum]
MFRFSTKRHAYHDFAELLDTTIYQPLPDEWLVGITDVVNSTSAVNAGRYKDVNYAGASAIAALGNAWNSFDFPFVFRGDGAAFAFHPDRLETATAALRQTVGHVRDVFQLDLRAGLVSVREIRAGGKDVRTARFSASETAIYSMFAGGGLNWADRQIKSGKYGIADNVTDTSANLSGLTCEWAPIPSRSGEILSLLVEPCDHSRSTMFAKLAKQIVAVFDTGERHSHPVPNDIVITQDVEDYLSGAAWADVVANSDYRRYDDVLRLTLDCTAEQIGVVEALLVRARNRGDIRFGLHRQSHALMTCLVPSGNKGSHLHFLDGMGGGYTKAAEMLEAQ